MNMLPGDSFEKPVRQDDMNSHCGTDQQQRQQRGGGRGKAMKSRRSSSSSSQRSTPSSDIPSDGRTLEQMGKYFLSKSGRKRKKQMLLKILAEDLSVANLEKLRSLACSPGGLIDKDIRHKVWPKLLNIDFSGIPSRQEQNNMVHHKYYEQVVMDVERSLKRFPPGMKDKERFSLQHQMIRIIMRILIHHQDLHYYQGFHDICVTFLLVVGETKAVALCDKLTQSHLREFMEPTMERTSVLLNYLYPIIGKSSPRLQQYMERAEVGTIFALPWLLTWYGHVLADIRHILRLYDFFLASHPLMPVYMGAAIVLYREEEVLGCDCDMPSIHSLLSNIPPDLPYEALICKSRELFALYPPDELKKDSATLERHRLSFQEYQQLMEIRNVPAPSRGRRDDSATQIRHISQLMPELSCGRTWMKYGLWFVTGSLAAVTWLVVREWQL